MKLRKVLLSLSSVLLIVGCAQQNEVQEPRDLQKSVSLEEKSYKSQIAFASDRDGNPEIYSMNSDGSEHPSGSDAEESIIAELTGFGRERDRIVKRMVNYLERLGPKPPPSQRTDATIRLLGELRAIEACSVLVKIADYRGVGPYGGPSLHWARATEFPCEEALINIGFKACDDILTELRDTSDIEGMRDFNSRNGILIRALFDILGKPMSISFVRIELEKLKDKRAANRLREVLQVLKALPELLR